MAMTNEQLKPYGFRGVEHWERVAAKSFPGRWPKNKGITGPDWPGCFNTGFAPLIYRCKSDGKYLVGHRLDVEFVYPRRDLAERYVALGDTGKNRKLFRQRVWTCEHKRKVYIFGNRKAAVAKWANLCARESKAHAVERWKTAEAAQRARSNDPATAIAGILELGLDH
jgi:hypothetical protein